MQRETGARPSVVQHLGFLVELAADAVATKFAHHREAMAFGVALDNGADVAQVRARLYHANPSPHRLVSDFAQAPRLNGWGADVKHAASVAVKTVLDHGDVDVDDVAWLELLVSRDAVAHHMVD